jgi:ATP/ADP translocase
LQVLPYVIVFGVGLTLTVSPLTSAILGSIESERSGIASAVNNAVSRVAGLLVIAMLGTIIGGRLDLEGFHRGGVVTALMMIVGGLVSFAGIRNRLVIAGEGRRTQEESRCRCPRPV